MTEPVSGAPCCRCAHSALIRTPGMHACYPERCNPRFDPFSATPPEYNWFIPREPFVVRVLDRLFSRAPKGSR